MTSQPVFGLFWYLWSVLHSYISRTSLKLVWKWTETPGKEESRYTCLLRTKVQKAAFTLIQINHTNSAVAPQFILIKPNLSSANALSVSHQAIKRLQDAVLQNKKEKHTQGLRCIFFKLNLFYLEWWDAVKDAKEQLKQLSGMCSVWTG